MDPKNYTSEREREWDLLLREEGFDSVWFGDDGSVAGLEGDVARAYMELWPYGGHEPDPSALRRRLREMRAERAARDDDRPP